MLLRSIVIVFGLVVSPASIAWASEPSSENKTISPTSRPMVNPFTSWKTLAVGFSFRDQIGLNTALEEQTKGEKPMRLLPATNKNRELFPKRILHPKAWKGWAEAEEIDVAKFNFDAIQVTEEGKTLVVWLVDENLGFLGKLDRTFPGRTLIRFPYTANCSRSGYALSLTPLDESSEKETIVQNAGSTR